MYMRPYFLWQKEANVLFEIHVKNHKTLPTCIQQFLYIYKVFLSGQPHSIKSAVN
jgi:hypothetical protein